MKGVPIPETRQGWTIAAILAFLAFAAYYLLIFPRLTQFYESDLYVAQSAQWGDPISRCRDEAQRALEGLVIWVKSPRHIAPFVKRWISVSIRNNGDSLVKDVEWWLGEKPQDNTEIKSPIFPFLFEGSSSLQSAVHFPQIAPHATVTGRAPAFVAGYAKEPTLKMWVRVQDCIVPVNVTGDIVPLQNEGVQSLAHSLVENLLLPPWSNGLLVAVVFIASHLAEEEGKDEGGKRQFLQQLLNALQSLIGVWMWALSLVCIPWLWQWETLLLLLPFLLLCCVRPLENKIWQIEGEIWHKISVLPKSAPLLTLKSALSFVLVKTRASQYAPILQWALLPSVFAGAFIFLMVYIYYRVILKSASTPRPLLEIVLLLWAAGKLLGRIGDRARSYSASGIKTIGSENA